MDIGNILKQVGTGIIKQVFPAAGAIINVVNDFLPDNKKLSEDATGSQVSNAINELPADQKASILNKQLDVEIEDIKSWTNIVGSLASADASGASTRPKIAIMMAQVVCYAVIVGITAWAYGIVTKSITIEGSWPLITAIIATPTILLRAYFGLRTKEKKARYETATGNPISNVAGNLLQMFKSK